MTPDFKRQIQRWRSGGALSLETSLLLAAVGVRADREIDHWNDIITKETIRWEDLIDLAAPLGARPLLWRFLNSLNPSFIPADALSTLRQWVRENTLRNLKMTGELVSVLKVFEQHDISAIPYKGPTLAALAYGDLKWREFGDLDILISRDKLTDAGELLLERGYEPEYDPINLRNTTFLKICNALTFKRLRDDITIELHWELSPPLLPFEFSMEQALQRLKTVSLAGRELTTLAPEPLLLYLSSHGSRHHWSSLGLMADIAWLIHRNPQIDWDETLRLADATKTRRFLWLSLLLASGLLDLSLPDEISRQITRDAEAQQLATLATQWLLLPEYSNPGTFAHDLFYLKLQQGIDEKAGYLLRLFTTPNIADWQFLPLPRSLRFLYPAVRSIRLIRDMLQSL